MAIYSESKNFVIENNKVKITVSSETALVESVFDKINQREMVGEKTYFFSFVENDKKTEVFPKSLSLEGNTFVVESPYGTITVEAVSEDDYFTFELTSNLPDEIYKLLIAHIRYDYDREDEKSLSAAGMAVTYWANPCFYPDGKSKETKAEVVRYLKDKGAKYAFFVAPLKEHKELLKKITLTIDVNTGLRSIHGGAWGQESKLNHDNGVLAYYTEDEYLDENIPFFESLGVDQIDLCQGGPSAFYQGSFEYRYHKDAADFKKRFSDRLAKHGMYPGLHTYSAMVALDSATILSKPENQKQMVVKDKFTLSSDIDENAMIIPLVENCEEVSCDFSFLSINSPLIIIDGEVMRYDHVDGGVALTHRGYAGTKAMPHKKGAEVIHLSGLYYNVTPIIGSELYYEIARNTAKAFDEGGYESIYLDALDACYRFIDDREDMWFYCAAFICEILKSCKKTPMIEASCMYPSMWAARGRFGAWDIGRRGFKAWNDGHTNTNKMFLDMHATATLGWYSFYPTDNKHPGNFHTRYQYIDDMDHLGTLSILYDFGMVFNDIEPEHYFSTPAMRRNIAHYRKYDTLRKKHYFSEDIIEKVKNGKYEYAVKENDGKFVFVEKAYQQKKLYNVADSSRNSGKFNNPFKSQNPFVRIVAQISSNGENFKTLINFDKNAPISREMVVKEFEQELNLTPTCARRVSVLGNGKKGAVAILIYGRETGRDGIMAYYIDTDFEGWREFILAESDNGDRRDLDYEHRRISKTSLHFDPLYYYLRTNCCDDRTFKIEVDTDGDVEGVKISDIEVCDHTFEVLKNPTVKIGDSTVTFNCDLKSTDYIEFDGEKAIMYDRIGNETPVAFAGSLTAPEGEFTATLSAQSDSTAPLRASLVLGFEGEIVK